MDRIWQAFRRERNGEFQGGNSQEVREVVVSRTGQIFGIEVLTVVYRYDWIRGSVCGVGVVERACFATTVSAGQFIQRTDLVIRQNQIGPLDFLPL